MGEGARDLAREFWLRLRTLLRRPGYTAVVVVTLALGVGATAAIYGVVDAVLLRPPPYESPDELVVVLQSLGDEEGRGMAGADIDYIKGRVESFQGLMWFLAPESMTLTGLGDPEQLQGRRVSVDFFEVLGVEPARGRGFRPDEDVEGRDAVVVLAHDYWQSRFAAAPDIVGRELRISDRVHTVVGVMPPSFRFEMGGSQDLFLPRVFDTESGNYTGWFRDRVIGRLAPGVGLERAAAEMDRMAATLEEEFPTRRTDVPITLRPLHEELVGDSSLILQVLFAAVALVMVVACANLAHLALARLSDRQDEVALRAVLGASRSTLIREQLVEAGILSAMGTAAGVLVAVLALPVFVSLSPAEIPGLTAARVDGRVLVFVALLGVSTTLVFGALPALLLGKELRGSLAGGGRGGVGKGSRLRQLLMTGETALVTGLLLLAALLAASLQNLMATDPGFQTDGRTAVQLTVPSERYPTAPEIQAFFGEVIDGLEALPGVRGVGGISTLPLGGEGITIPAPIPEGQELTGPAVATRPRTGWDAVTRGYFQAVGMPLIRGRSFDATDAPDDSTKAIVINQAFSRVVFQGEDPVGKRVGFGTPPSMWMRVVGVVGDVRHGDLGDEPRIAFYQLAEQVTFAWPTMEVVVRTEPGATLPAGVIRDAVWAVDPDQPVTRIRSLASVRNESVAEERYKVLITGAFALLALILGAVGIYGVVGYATARRTREFGVRLALGARGGSIRTMVVRETLIRVGAGVALGIGGGMAGAWLLRSWFFGVSPTSPWAAAVVAAVLLATGVAAAYLPALRASRTDPVVALSEG